MKPAARRCRRVIRPPSGRFSVCSAIGEVSRLIKRCNDFGAGGVCVAIGELADGLKIDLNAVPKKYEGLDGTELAISESQERMAVVLDPKEDVQAFLRCCGGGKPGSRAGGRGGHGGTAA